MVAVLCDKPAVVLSMLYSYISIDPRDDRYMPFYLMLNIGVFSTWASLLWYAPRSA